MNPAQILRKLFDIAVAAALPEKSLQHFMPKKPKGKTLVVGAGKASAAMAAAFEKCWAELYGTPLNGLVVTRYGHAVPCRNIEIIEASHPVPDAAGLEAAQRILAMVQNLSADDLVVALISGGGSALLSLPAAGLTIEDKQTANQLLLSCGAPISEMNAIRKRLSTIKGGRLGAAAFPARVESLIISDVPGDDLSAIASGPTVADETSFADALRIIETYGLQEKMPARIMQHLKTAQNETPKPGDQKLAHCRNHLIASPQLSLMAASDYAKSIGIMPLILGDSLEGEAREMGRMMAGMALQARRFGQPLKPPCVLLSGGESTVTLRGKGIGGRNVEFLLSLALKLQGAENIHALAADTDGIDGAAEVAGALISPDTLSRARGLGLDAAKMLNENDAHSFFAHLQNQIITGPTLTNVNDFRAILIV